MSDIKETKVDILAMFKCLEILEVIEVPSRNVQKKLDGIMEQTVEDIYILAGEFVEPNTENQEQYLDAVLEWARS